MSLHPILWILAWFAQMGIHEGMHAYAAKWRGDDTAEALGKKSFNPFVHIDPRDPNSVIGGVVLPIVTSLQGFPMGMAWVPVNPARFGAPRRDWAIVAAAGPLGNVLLCAALLPLHAMLNPFREVQLFARMIDDAAYAIYVTSMIYGVFNLVPIPPLDGSRVLYYFLPAAGRDLMEEIAPYGFILIIVLFWIGDAGRLLAPFVAVFRLLWGWAG